MADKKLNDADNWKGMLDSPKALPHEGLLDKNAAWGKLQDRLHTRPARRATWYWVAATVLTMIAVSWLITGRKKNDIAKPTDSIVHDTKIMQPSRPANLNRQPSVEKTTFIKQPVARGTNAVHRKPNYRNTVSFYPSLVVVSSISTVESPPAATIVAPVTGDSTKLALVFRPKKKLRVLHVNELGVMTLSDSEQLALAAQEKSNTKFRLKSSAPGNLSSPGRQEDTGIRIPLTN